MGKGSGGDSSATVRYAPYIEEKHKALLDEYVVRRTAVIDNSPYANITDIPSDDGFFGVGYTLASFPSLYDMYGKFMAGLDVEVLYDQVYGDLMEGPVTRRLISAEAQFLTDELESDALPRFETGMRDLNAVMSSTFVIGRALLEETRLKLVEKYSAGLQYALLPVVTQRWQTHLEWNKGVIATYAEVMKLYFSAKIDIDDHNQEVKAKDRLWPFTVLDYERVAIAAMQGATKSTNHPAGGGTIQRAISGAMGGAAMGGMAGSMISGATAGSTFGVHGAVIGGILGLAGAL
jgi:hypothetical protein